MSTLRDVAKLSGVSPATVTHVLHNRRNISGETRERVLDAVRTLGYRPGAVPNAAERKRGTRTVGVFIWLETHLPLQNNSYATQILDGILAGTLVRGWNITLFNVTAWDDAQSQVRHSADGRCDGFLLVAPPTPLAIPDALRERGYPFVLINSGSNNPTVSSVDIDNRAAARDLTAYLIDQGHRRLAFLPGVEGYDNTNQRLQGFLEMCAERNVPDPSPWILRPGDYDFAQSRERVVAMAARIHSLPQRDRPTALLCGNDVLAEIASTVLVDQGILVPEQMSITGFDNIERSRRIRPTLTTVHQPLHDLGKRATEILIEGIESFPGATAPLVKEYLPYTVVYRESVTSVPLP